MDLALKKYNLAGGDIIHLPGNEIHRSRHDLIFRILCLLRM